jgi:hypothetical protein
MEYTELQHNGIAVEAIKPNTLQHMSLKFLHIWTLFVCSHVIEHVSASTLTTEPESIIYSDQKHNSYLSNTTSWAGYIILMVVL